MTTQKQIEAAAEAVWNDSPEAKDCPWNVLNDTAKADCRRIARTALDAAEAAAWEDISTAPKDGTQVDLWCENPNALAGGRRVPDCHWYGKGWLGEVLNATHWRPLPKGPRDGTNIMVAIQDAPGRPWEPR